MDNTVKTDKGIDVYQDNIRYFVDEYLNDLDDKDTIRKTPIFKGMLK